MYDILYNRPALTGKEKDYVSDALVRPSLAGDGYYGKKCQDWFEEYFDGSRCFLTPSCTHALEMSALLADIRPGDEVIMPSYTFVSTANAFALRGARIVFVDIREDTLNLDESLVEAAITPRTRAVVPVHYAGVGCNMETICRVAEAHSLLVVEDAAQAISAKVGGRILGGIGDLAALSFHETKNVTSGGEGGLLVINNERFIERAEVVREKGTNRARFFRGMVDKYRWEDLGSSYLPSELQAAYLLAQLEKLDVITTRRRAVWAMYQEAFSDLDKGRVRLPTIPPDTTPNGHIFYLLTAGLEERTALIAHLKDCSILATFHYQPLHSSPGGKRFGRFHGEDRITTQISDRLVRLPLFFGITDEQVRQVIDAVLSFYTGR